MRIAFIIRSLTYGGAERQMSLLATGLQQAGHPVSVHIFYPGGEFERFLRSSGVPVEVIGKKGTWDSWHFLRRAAASLRRYEPEIVHGYIGGGNIASVVLKRSIGNPKIVWGIRSSKFNFQGNSLAVRLSAFLERTLARRADLIISNSESGRKACLARSFPADRIKVVPNGVDLDWFERDAQARKTWRSAHGIPHSDILVGRVGRLDPVKDFPLFLRAAALVGKVNPLVRFACIGPGSESYLQELRALAEQLGIADRVLWTGPLSNMREVYNGLDLLVSSSISEGFPNVILEAMACGVPCVTTDAGDASQIVAGTGIVVPVGDGQALAKGMIELLQEAPEPLAVREVVVQNYSFARMVQRTEQLLQSLLSEPRPAAAVAPGVKSQSPQIRTKV